MLKQSSNQNDASGNRPGPKRYRRVIQKPAKPGTITFEQALEAARWVKQQRTRTPTQ
jgi:hypothetical protein